MRFGLTLLLVAMILSCSKEEEKSKAPAKPEFSSLMDNADKQLLEKFKAGGIPPEAVNTFAPGLQHVDITGIKATEEGITSDGSGIYKAMDSGNSLLCTIWTSPNTKNEPEEQWSRSLSIYMLKFQHVLLTHGAQAVNQDPIVLDLSNVPKDVREAMFLDTKYQFLVLTLGRKHGVACRIEISSAFQNAAIEFYKKLMK